MIIPSQFQEKVLREVHGGRSSGHLGVDRVATWGKPKHYSGLESSFTGLECQGV